jgi:nitrate/nitrite transporter NarK
MEKKEVVVPKYRWVILVGVFLGFIALTLNWFCVPPTRGALIKEFSLSEVAFGALVSLFLLGYGIFQIPAGIVAAKYGPKVTFIIGLIIESVFGILSGLSPNYCVLVGSRFIAGVGAAFFFSPAEGEIVEWFSRAELGLALGLSASTAFALGAGITLFSWMPIVESLGWRWGFWIAGIIGLVIAAINAVIIKSPPPELVTPHKALKAKPKISDVFRVKDVWLLGFGLLGGYGAYMASATFLPGFLIEVRGFMAISAGLMTALLTLAGIPAAIGGVLSDRVKNRKLFIIIPGFIGALLFWLLGVATGPIQWVVVFLAGFVLMFAFSPLLACASQYPEIGPRLSSLAIGLIMTIGVVGSMCIPMAYGHLIDLYSSFYPAWCFGGIITVVFAVCWIFIRDPFKIQESSQKGEKAQN